MNRVKLLDILSGKDVWGYYQVYKETQWYSEEEMTQFRLEKLKKLISHCYVNVPYYSEFMKSRKINPGDVRSFDILKEFPIITKETIKENYDKFIPVNIKEIRNVKYSQTGGTTGNILLKRTDANVRGSAWGTNQRYFDWMGISDSDPKLVLMGGHVYGKKLMDEIKKKVLSVITTSWYFNPYDLSEENVRNICNALETKNIRLIQAYSQGLYVLGKIFRDQGKKFQVKSITTTAEPLMEHQRLLFRDVFSAESFDQYGCGEIGGIAYECNHHKGLHVTEERVYLEFNEQNDLIITDLDNFAMPYIRYWNADQAIRSAQKCSCGRKSMLLEKIMGRTCDYIHGVNGNILHWAFFWHLMFDTEIAIKRDMKKFQVRQTTAEQLIFRIVSNPLTPEDQSLLRDLIQQRLGSMDIVFKQENDIENSKSGKYRPVVNDMIV